MVLAFIGVVIHELCHTVACVFIGIRPLSFKVHFYDKETGQANPHGMISHETHHLSFLQDLMIAIAPLLFSTWLFFWSLDLLLNHNKELEVLTLFLLIFFCISLLLGATPSGQDFRSAWISFKKAPRYSLYQIFLLLLAGYLVWHLLILFHITVPIEIIYYIMVAFMYMILKYSFRGLGLLIHFIAGSRRSVYSHPNMNYNRYNRRQHRPSKTRKLLFEEWDWE